jgi:hypothetical protein
MAQVTPPNLPLAPDEYQRQFQDQLNSILRLFFLQLTNPGPIVASTQRKPATAGSSVQVVSALSCSEPSATGAPTISLPTQADFANLRSGDIYYDTSGGAATSYPLRIKA